MPPDRHSRERGNPEPSASSLQSVIPANAGIQRLQRHPSRPSFPRRRAPLYFGGAEHPEPSAPSLQAVIPANAGIQRLQAFSHERPWIPAFAGMTRCGNVVTGDW
ncbi:hypothetical protein [Lysobacter gummosus]|uniref:hypothetical protein n=1 Tax=Lysobacter gummosus TaxID=262324 RepID=UPI00362F34C7